MKTIGFSAISAVLVIVAASSLVSMIGLFQIDRIVNQDLYRYGLEFSYVWAMPYWTITKLIFATGWFNIIAAIAFHLYILAYGQKETQQIEPQTEKQAYNTEIIETTPIIKEEKTDPEPETKPTEPVEQQKEQELKPTETVEEKPKEAQATITETQTQAEEKKEETPTPVADTSTQTQTEPKQPEQTPQPQPEQAEQQKEPQKVEDPKQPIATETPQTEQKDTETKPPETQPKSEETPTKTQLPQEQELQSTSVL